MAGLDSIKNFDEGGAISYKPPQSTGIAEKIPLSPDQTEGMLASMQKLIDERESPFARFASGLSKGVATAYGPTALANFEKQQQEQDKQLMDFRQQMAAWRAAQEQAKINEQIYTSKLKRPETTTQTGSESINTGVTAPSGMIYSGIPVPESVQARLKGNSLYDTPILEDWLKTRTTEAVRKEMSPAMSTLVEVFGIGQMPLHMAEKLLMNKPDLQAVVNGKKVPLTSIVNDVIKQDIAESKTTDKETAKSVAMPKAEVPLEGLPTPFFAQESSSGKADTSKPGIQGAQGPMQVTKKTFDDYKAKGIIPKDYDLNDPGQAYASGILILNELHKKHNKDINKVAAEYFGGSGAINADGTINVNRQDANGKNVGDYVNDIRSRMGLPKVDLGVAAPSVAAPSAAAPSAAAPSAAAPSAAAPSAAAPSAAAPSAAPASIKSSQVMSGPPEPPNKANYMFVGGQAKYEADKAKYDEDVKVFNQTRTELAKSNIASIKEEADKFIARTDYDILGERAGTNDYLKTLVKKWGGNPNVAGVLNDPTWGNAIATALQKGVSTPGGNIAMPDIVEILQKTRPGATTDEIEASKELARVLGQRILDVVQKSKGSSSDKDWIAFKQIAGSADNGWDALQRIQKYDEAQIKKDKAERQLFNDTYNGQTFDYNKHIINPKRIELYDNYGKELSDINRTHYKFEVTPPRPGNVPQGAMYNPKLKKWGWYDQNKKWVTN